MARRAKPETVAADAAPAPTPQERWAQHWPLIRDAKAALDAAQEEVASANGEYRNLLKAYKKAGGDSEALVAALKLQKLEPSEVTKHIAGVNWHLRNLGVLVGQQLGFGFEQDGRDIAHHVDNDKLNAAGVNQNGADDKPADGFDKPADGFDKPADGFDKPVMTTEAMIAKARTAGFDAGAGGKNRDTNPHADGSPEFLAFDAEWMRGQEKIAASMAPKGRRGAAGEARPSA